MDLASLLNALRCSCGGNLHAQNNAVICQSCQKKYGAADKPLLIFTSAHDSQTIVARNPDGLMAKLKYFFKKYPKVFFILAWVFGGRQVNLTAQKFVNRLPPQTLAVNIGSGTKSLGRNVVDLDFFPFPNVSVVAPVEQLPFKDNSLDAIICDNVLEHVKNPGAVVAEVKRVLKLGGLVYVGVPFIINYHSSPHDYQRWTVEGLRNIMAGFKEQETKIACGPTSAMVTVLTEWLALVLSFNSNFLYNLFLIFFTVLLTPIKYLDYLFSFYKKADNIAYGFYYVGKK